MATTPMRWGDIGSATSPDAVPAEYSDDALAQVFANRHGDDLRFTAPWSRWSMWTGSRWETDEMRKVTDLARKVCREISESCQDARLARHISSARTISAVERLAQADQKHHAAKVEQWDADPWILNTPSGVVDLRTGVTRPARRDDYCTKTTAVAPDGDCPRWRAFLARTTNGDQEFEAFLQRMCGYALTGVTREHALFFLYGTGANGKSKFVEAISGALGDYAKVAPVEMLLDSKNPSHPTDVAGLQGARLVTAQETEAERHWAEAKVKTLTGGDRVTARFMRGDYFEFIPAFKLLVTGNHKPSLRNPDEAMRRRLNMLPFTITIPAEERDPKLGEKLKTEWPGILQWAIEGCLAWQREGLNPPAIVTRATTEYFADEDALARWVEERVARKTGAFESTSALFADWKAWADAAGEFVGNPKRFSLSLESRGYCKSRKNKARGFDGLILRRGLVTDGDGFSIYPSRARVSVNQKTRHYPSLDGELALPAVEVETPLRDGRVSI